jgi:hypothetical protein
MEIKLVRNHQVTEHTVVNVNQLAHVAQEQHKHKHMRRIMKNTIRKHYYVQLLIQQDLIENDILKGYYAGSFVPDILKLIKKETSKYTEKLQG